MGDDAHKADLDALAEDADAELQAADLDVEMALLTLSAHDMGEPTEDLDISTLTPNEKQVLLDLLRKRLGNVPTAATPHPADTTINSGQGKSA